jgi:hypothetical protein
MRRCRTLVDETGTSAVLKCAGAQVLACSSARVRRCSGAPVLRCQGSVLGSQVLQCWCQGSVLGSQVLQCFGVKARFLVLCSPVLGAQVLKCSGAQVLGCSGAPVLRCQGSVLCSLFFVLRFSVLRCSGGSRQSAVRSSQFAVRSSQFAVRILGPRFVVHRSSFIIPSFIIHRSSFIVPHSRSPVLCSLFFVLCSRSSVLLSC